MKFIERYWKTVLGVGIGAFAGFGYYYFIGCNTGTCALTSKPLPSTMYGALIGLVWMFPATKKEKK